MSPSRTCEYVFRSCELCCLPSMSAASATGFPTAGVTRYSRDVERTLLQRIHNPHNYECGCDPDCWCRRTRSGRLVKWWFPARYFGIRHKNSFFDGMTGNQIREWKREQADKGMYP